MAYIPEEPIPDEFPIPLALDERQKALRDLFVGEYLIDFNSVAAAQRCGFSRINAIEYSQKFLQEPYVQQKIKNMELTPVDEDREIEFNRQRVKQQLMREAYYHGPGSSHAARVAALGKLMSIYSMEAPKRTKNENMHEYKGGVMRVPTAAASAEEWEAQAVANQESLANGEDPK